MPFIPSVAVNVRQATTSGSISSLNHVMIADVNAYHKAFVTPYYSIDDVNNDSAIPKNSKAYAALSIALSNASSLSLPVYLGRVQMSGVKLVPTAQNSSTYSFEVTVINTTTGVATFDKELISFTSDADATVAEITLGLGAALTTAGITATDLVVTDNTTDLELVEAADRQLILTSVTENLALDFSTTTSAAQAYADITSENLEDWYRLVTTVRDDDWIVAMASTIQSTESSDYPKLFHVSSAAPETLVALTDPYTAGDLAGRIAELGYGNTTVEWHDKADTIFPEAGNAAYIGGFFVGTKGIKFSANANIPEARHPILGRKLTKGEVGFITDRGACVRTSEMGVTIYVVGNTGDTGKVSNWLDNLSISHWIRLTMKLRVFNKLVNADNGGLPLTFTKGDRLVIKDVADSVLNEAVDRRMLSGHTGVKVPETVSFEDQAQRMLKDLEFVGYFAGKINNIIINGILTYSENV